MRLFQDSTIIINSVNDLSIEEALKLKQQGYYYVQIKAEAHPNIEEYDGVHEVTGYWIQNPYDIDTYIAIRIKLNELIEDIDLNLPEEKKFAIIYERICKNITYDYPAGYPKTKSEREYEKAQKFKCHDLTNGLLEGKCVCDGYACILQAALQLVGLDAHYVDRPNPR